jgi:GDP-D-mannose dehydratase
MRNPSHRISLYNVQAEVDIGHAYEFMECAYRTLQLYISDDYCIGTGKAISIFSLAILALDELGIEDPEKYIHVNESPYLPIHPRYVADISKIRKAVGFCPYYEGASLVAKVLKEMEVVK